MLETCTGIKLTYYKTRFFALSWSVTKIILRCTVSNIVKSDFLSIFIVITMQTITIESNTKLHTITVMFTSKKWLKVDESRDCIYLFPLSVF